jgi:hypothetical protein
VLEEEERSVVDPGQPGSGAPSETEIVVLGPDGVLHLLPLDAERWIGQAVVEATPGMAVLVKEFPQAMWEASWPFSIMSERQMA